MAVIRPFRAVRPPADKATSVASVPYDVVNAVEARALAAGNPYSFLHVSRAEIDLPDGTDAYSDAVYRQAFVNYEELIKTCPLEAESSDSIYLYRLIMNGRAQIGVVTCCSLDEYDTDVIKKHERTRREKEDDRTRHMLMLRAQTGPVFLTYRSHADIDALVREATEREPLFDFTADDGIQHTVWRAADPAPFVAAFRAVPSLYIADGHHRAASASRARAELREQSFGHMGDEEYNFFLTVIFPDDQVHILSYNRVVKDLNGLTASEFLARVRESFTVTEEAPAEPAKSGNWGMYFEGKWYGLSLASSFVGVGVRVAGNVFVDSDLLAEAPSDKASSVVDSLDVSILQQRLLDPILGIKDVRTDKRIDFVGGIRGTAELERLVNEDRAAMAFSLFPTTVADLLKVSDAGEIMPPKSTWFEPKLRDGLLIHTI